MRAAAKTAPSRTASRPRCSGSSPIPSSSTAASAEPATAAAGKPYRVNDLALASRLSFFLWSSIPDDELIDLAAAGKLRTPAVLEQQVRRMLTDPHADALITNFTGQWLSVRSLKTSEPVVNVFPDFDDNLRNAFESEIELFFAQRRPGGSQRPRSADGRLHLRQRAAGQALRHPERLRPAVPPRDAAGGARHAPRPARQGRDADRHVGGGAHVAGDARQMVPEDVPRHRAAAIRRRSVDTTLKRDRRHDRQHEGTDDAADAGSAPHRVRRARRATRSSSRWGWRWRTSTPWARGERSTRASRSMPSGVLADGTKVNGVTACAQSLVRYRDQFARVVAEKLLTYASAAASSTRHAARALDRERSGGEAISILVARAGDREERHFQMNMKTATPTSSKRLASEQAQCPTSTHSALGGHHVSH